MEKNELLSRITIDPKICHGKPCIRGLRYPVATILEYIAAGDNTEDILALRSIPQPSSGPLGVVWNDDLLSKRQPK